MSDKGYLSRDQTDGVELVAVSTGMLAAMLRISRARAVMTGIDARAWIRFGGVLFWDARKVADHIRQEAG